MKAALYARVSTADQQCALQLAELRAYCERHGWQIVGEYVDEGESGAKATRPALDRMMADADQRLFDCVVVWKLDRFARSVLHFSSLIDRLRTHRVRFIATTQALDTDQSNPMSRLMINLLSMFAEFERDMIRERTMAGQQRARAAGKRIGPPLKVYDRAKAAELRASGMSWRKMAAVLNVPESTLRKNG